MNKKQIVRGMYAARECLSRLEQRRNLPTGLLAKVAVVLDEDAEYLLRHHESAFECPAGLVELPDGDVVEQREIAVAFFKDVIDDCRFLLREGNHVPA